MCTTEFSHSEQTVTGCVQGVSQAFLTSKLQRTTENAHKLLLKLQICRLFKTFVNS